MFHRKILMLHTKSMAKLKFLNTKLKLRRCTVLVCSLKYYDSELSYNATMVQDVLLNSGCKID